MTNDENRMTNQNRSPKDEKAANSGFGAFPAFSAIRHSSF